jgi:BirA family biotin operon repressor/biotin-[acetyl-CoA-carboxylase] ligase
MTVQDHLQSLLEANKDVYLSGEEIALSLGVSRNAVWKAVKALQRRATPSTPCRTRATASRRRATCSRAPASRRYLTGEAKSLEFNVFDSVSSTNIVLRDLAENGAPEGTVVVASTQPAGAGAKGVASFLPRVRAFTSVFYSNPTSTRWTQPRLPPPPPSRFAKRWKPSPGERAEIKWVNDVFVGGKKICGILTEASFGMESGRLDYAILGTASTSTRRRAVSLRKLRMWLVAC